MTAPDISFILPIKGTQAELDASLFQISKFTANSPWELIVVDDNSPELLSLGDSTSTNWSIVRREGTSGAAAARNEGAKISGGHHLVFMSSFLQYPPDYVEKVKAFISANAFDFAQHPIVAPGDANLNFFQKFIGNQQTRVSASETLPVKQSLFTAAIIKRAIFQELGGFDASMLHYGGHEMDLIYRMDKAGFNRRIEANELPLKRLVVSDHSRTVDRLREYGSTGLPSLLKKHPELKKSILPLAWAWWPMSVLGITRRVEKCLSKRVDKNKKLTHYVYRLYLHLIVRNAWDAR